MKKILITILTLICLQTSFAYTDRPAIIHIDKNKQLDTNGFNIGKEILDATLQLVLQKKVGLYLSPKKESKISVSSLRAIEMSNEVSFEKIKDVFFHEYWTSNRRKTTFTIVGISFVGKSRTGENVSLGYVDLKEAWPFFSQVQVYMNENGNAGMSITEAMYSRRYSYNLIQLGKKDFKSKPYKSIQCRNYAFNGKKELAALTSYPRNKKVKYLIEQRISEPNEIGNIIYTNIASFMNENKEVLLNIGGNRHFDYKDLKGDVAITRLEVVENYTKLGNGALNTAVQELLIYVNNKPLNPVNIETLQTWNVIFNFKGIEDVLREKKFKYTLLQLNSVLIPEVESDWYLQGIKTYDWSRLTYFVESYRKKK